jgi:nucleoside-diphosphate-sugar epimerase
MKTMDAVLGRIAHTAPRYKTLASLVPQTSGPRVLVTGGTGFVGRPLVRRLVANGYRVRVLARKLAKVDAVHDTGAEIFWGDVADLESFGEAMSGCNLVVHLAAGTSGSPEDSETATLEGTRNLLELCRRHKPKRLVYISSCSVYGVSDYSSGALVPETASLERFPERRGNYSASRLTAEGYVAEFIKSGAAQTVILRPGTIYGPGGALYTPIMGFSIGSMYVVIGRGSLVVPLVYVENLVDAIALALEKEQAEGQVFNVVDPGRLTKRRYMDEVVRRVDPAAKVLYIPYSLIYAMTWLQERVFDLIKRRPVLSCYRLTSSQRSVVYDGSHIARRLGWRPNVSPETAMSALVTAERSRTTGPTIPRASATPERSVGATQPVEPGSAR